MIPWYWRRMNIEIHDVMVFVSKAFLTKMSYFKKYISSNTCLINCNFIGHLPFSSDAITKATFLKHMGIAG